MIDSLHNMHNLNNSNNLNCTSINSLGIGIRISNISNRNIGDLGNDMANTGGMNGVKQEKFNPNVFGKHCNLYPTDYLYFGVHIFKPKGSTPNFTNIVTYDGYNSNNNDTINSSNNSNKNNGGSSINN